MQRTAAVMSTCPCGKIRLTSEMPAHSLIFFLFCFFSRKLWVRVLQGHWSCTIEFTGENVWWGISMHHELYTDKEAKLKLVARRPVMEKQLHLRSTPTLVSSFTSSGILEILLKNRPRSAGHQWSRCSSRIGNLLPSCGAYGWGSLHWVSEYWLVTSSGKQFLWWELRKSRQSSEWKPTSSCGAALAQLWSTSTSSTSVKWS